jgi:hypothetical protein
MNLLTRMYEYSEGKPGSEQLIKSKIISGNIYVGLIKVILNSGATEYRLITRDRGSNEIVGIVKDKNLDVLMKKFNNYQ